jgi:uncharacterized heparinase superfamily protein
MDAAILEVPMPESKDMSHTNGDKYSMHGDVPTSNSYLFGPALPGPDASPVPYFASSMAHPSAGRYWRTLKHLRASQIFFLARHRVFGRNDITRWPQANVALKVHDRPPKMAEWQPVLARRIIRLGNVRFLEKTIQDSERSPWWAKEISRRQIYHANYCDFLNVDLRVPEEAELLHRATRIALSWCDQNPTGTELGWHQFFLSLRIVNWLKYLVGNAKRAEELGDGAQIQRVLASLRIQVLSLESRLERELLANHLLKNAKALVFAGALLEAPESCRWRLLGQQLLREQIAEQILADGGHIERSPMYHAWILDDLVDIQHLFEFCPPNAPECGSEVSECIERMTHYLSQIIHPDGEIPLLNDSQLDVTRPTAQILSDAGAPASNLWRGGTEVRVLRDTGYAIIRDLRSRSFLVFDCGPLGPDYQPGHGHSDVLSYELTLHGQRVIVDTGVSSYEPGPERHYERSTAAHNTIRIDGSEQAEIWGGFRVGRRPAVSPIDHREIAGCQLVQGAHFGYKRLGVVHSRTVLRLKGNSWVFTDSVRGKGSHKVESFIHFHPAIQVRPCAEAQTSSATMIVPRWLLQFDGLRYLFMTWGGGIMTQTQAWYSPGFAIRLPQSVIHWTWKGELPTTMLYVVAPEGTPPIIVSQTAGRTGIELDHVFVPLD